MTIENARMRLYQDMLWTKPTTHAPIAAFYLPYSNSNDWGGWTIFIKQGGLDELIIKTYKL